MRTRLAQLGAIIGYEMRMQWPRRSLLVVTVGFAIMVIGFELYQRLLLRSSGVHMDATTLRHLTTSTVLFAGPVGCVVLFLVLPPVLADIIPKDRQLLVRELFNSTPLGAGVYLAGKLASAWLSVMSTLVGVALPVGLLGRLTLGLLSLDVYLEMWVVAVKPLAFLTSAISVPLAAGQPNRRRAVLVGLALAVGPVLIWMMTDRTGFNPDLWWVTMNPAAWPEVLYTDGTNPLVRHPQLPQMVVSVLVQVAVAWLMVWGWMRWKETR